MVSLPRLLQNIDEYYNQAVKAARLTSLAQDPSKKKLKDREREAEEWLKQHENKAVPEEDQGEPEETSEEEGKNPPHFDDLEAISRVVEDPGLAQQLQTIAELYRYAVQLGGGYATIAQAINNLKNMYSDGTDSEIEGILNGIVKELAKNAGGVAALAGKDNPRFVQSLAQLKQDIDLRNASKSDAFDAYNEEIGDPEVQEEELAQQGLGEAVNPAALGFDNKEDPKTNKGWHTTGKLTPYKDWAKYYADEAEAYEADLSSERNPDTARVLEDLIPLLKELSAKTADALKLSDHLKIAKDPGASAKLKTLREEIGRIKETRKLLRSKIRSNQLQKQQQELFTELSGTRDPKEKELLKQKIALNQLSQSPDIYKAKERNYRIKLIEMMSGGNFPSAEQLQKELQKIEEASKKRMSVEQYNKQQAAQVAKVKQTFRPDPSVRKNVYNWAAMQMDGFITHLGQNLLGERKTAKDRILGTKNKNVSEEEKALFKPYMDAVATAANNKDRAALVAATRALREQIKKAIRLTPEFAKYLISVRSSKFFYTYRDRLKELQKMGTEQKGGVGDVEMQYLRDTVAMGEKLIAYYRDLKITPIKGKPFPTGYKTPTATIELVNGYLRKMMDAKDISNKTEKIDPETGEVTYE